MEKEEEQKKTNQSLRYSLVDSGFSSVASSINDNFLNPFALALGATTAQIGFLKSFPQIASSFFQLASTELSDRFMNRKKFVVISVLLQALMILPLLVIALYFNSVLLVIIFSSLYSMFGSFSNPPWSSWMGDLVEPKTRGRYFAQRNRIAGAFSLLTTLGSGLLLNHFKLIDNVLFGFVILFGISFIAKSLSLIFLSSMFEPEYVVKKESYFSLRSFIQKAHSNNFGRFALFMSFMNFAVNLGGPFFTVYLLKDLQFSYLQYTILTVVSAVSQFVGLRYWGWLSDRFGNKRVLLITGALAGLRPVLWMISPNYYFLIGAQLFNGFGSGGFDLTASNYILDAVSRERRTRCVSYYNFTKGMGIFLGALLGGLIALKLPHIAFLGYDIYLLFIISAILRFFAVLVLFPMLREVREGVESAPTDLFLRLAAVEPARELFNGAYTQLMLGIKNVDHVKNGIKRFGDRFKKK